MNDCILLETSNGIATLTLNRPAARNAFDLDMAATLNAQLTRIAGDDSISAVLIRANGKYFSAGGDIAFFRNAASAQPEEAQAALGHLIDNVHATIERIVNLRVPVVAAVQGGAAGFGLSLLAACDLVVASRDSIFSMAYMNLGATPDGGATWLLPRLIGLRQARELILLSDRFSGEDALRLGLIDRLVAPEEVSHTAHALATRLSQGPAQAQARLKSLLASTFRCTLPEQLAAEKESFLASACTDDFREGLAAFGERRAARFNAAGITLHPLVDRLD